MRVSLTEDETWPIPKSSDGIQYGTVGSQEDRKETCPAPEQDHITTNMLNPPNQLITCRHWLVWPVAFLFMIAYNCTFYVFGQYVYIKLQREKFPNVSIETKSKCELNTSSIDYEIQLDVQQSAATWGIYLYLSGGIMTVVSSFVLGAYTDRFGRKFLFILPMVGTAIRTAVAIVGIKNNLPLSYYMIGYFIEGCTGQVFTIFQICYTYVSDITPVGKKRSLGIVIIGVAFGLGTAVIQIGAGYLLKYTDFLVPFYISLGLLVFTLFLVLLLPETYPKEMRKSQKTAPLCENLKDSVDLYVGSNNAGRRWMYIVNLLAFTFTTYNLYGRAAMEGLYLLNAPFCWGPEKIGIFGTLKTGFQELFGMFLVALFQLFMGDPMISVVGCVSYGASFVLEGLAKDDRMMYIGKYGSLLLAFSMLVSLLSW